MTHIRTTSEDEAEAKKLYKRASVGKKATASSDLERLCRRYAEVSQKADCLALEISTIKGAIMKFMQDADALLDSAGKVIATWRQNSDKEDVDWEGVAAECDIPPSVIQRHTTVKPGSRVFKVEG